MKRLLYLAVFAFLTGCRITHQLDLPKPDDRAITGNGFYKLTGAMKWNEREPLMMKEILAGNIPAFLKKLVPVHVVILDSLSGKMIRATYFVTPDYLSIGNDKDFARVPMTPMTAQAIADSLHCFLPTRKMVDDIYRQARVKLEPVPLFAFRDSAISFYHHHLIIEGQRKGRQGLIAGIKKDIVITSRLYENGKRDRVAIYGWHKPNGQPIQALYTGHVNWYVDYSHGIRLVFRMIFIGNHWLDYTEVLKNKVLAPLLCDEGSCGVYRY